MVADFEGSPAASSRLLITRIAQPDSYCKTWFYNTWFLEVFKCLLAAMDACELVGWNLRRLRVARRISQDDLALNANVERAYVGHLERGQRNPTVATLARLAGALDVHISEFFARIDDGVKPEALRPGRRKKA